MRILLFMLLMLTNVSTYASSENESIQELSSQLKEAMEVRNFKVAKDILHDMIPLMKREIKESYKLISKAEKGMDVGIEDLGAFKKELQDKERILDYTQHIMNISSAALRASSNELMAKIDEYVQ